MAKISFTKLGLTKNQETKTLIWNDQSIEIKQYLPISEVLTIVENVVNKSHNGSNNFSNPIQVEVYTTLEILFNYTNINFTDKQKEDVLKLYDLVIGSGLYKNVIDNIPKEEISHLTNTINSTIDAVYKYQNSILGILDTVKSDYGNLNLEATEIQEKLADPNNLSLLRDVVNKLG